MDNASTQTVDNTDTQQTQQTQTQDFAWKSQLPADYANSPMLKTFPDNKEGFANYTKSYLEAQKLMGVEKVPIPKDEKDAEGWNRLAKALGVPDKADAYGLADPDLPESMKGISIDKAKFAEIVHAHKLTPGQAKGLWGAYTDMLKSAYNQAAQSKQSEMKDTINRLRSEWGDAYDTKVELGQMVINKFSSDKDMQDWVTASILSHPNGIKFLSSIGNQFAENKIGEFGYKKFSLTPDQAQAEIDQIVRDPKHPYNNDKLPRGERQRAIDYVNGLYATINRARGQA